MAKTINEFPILDQEALDEVREVLEARFGQILEFYFEDSDGYIEALRQAVAEDSAEKAVSPAHTLKSSSRQMGAFRVSEIARQIEELARGAVAGSGGLDQVPNLVERLAATFGETREAFTPYAA